MTKLKLAARAAAVCTLGLMALGLAAAAPASTAVTIENFTFAAPVVTVAAGQSVTWTNDDDVPHTVRAVDGSFHSKPMDTADTYSVTFARPGVYSYFCSLHPKMVGKVIVK